MGIFYIMNIIIISAFLEIVSDSAQNRRQVTQIHISRDPAHKPKRGIIIHTRHACLTMPI